ncbi:MAG: T9SS type A sorting domain-containing protein [Saprospiraceae bacterium]|nr:T9SS type A sorting domain-containing protein [Saprospiraceae bacterium]
MRAMINLKAGLLVCLLFTCLQPCISQDFMMQGWFWDYPKPLNPNGDPNFETTWAKTLINQAPALGTAGFTYLWLPPASRASFGSNSNGYDPKDLYDLGEFGQGATGFAFRQDVDNLITALSAAGVEAVADVVYNHRDGGAAEANPAVKAYIVDAYGDPNSENPFPSDRFRCVLPLGGSSGNGAGDYYIKIRSETEHSRFFDKPYRIYLTTDVVGWQGLPDLSESEPNGGGDCGQSFNTISLGRNYNANIDAIGCKTDEFLIQLSASDFNASGDHLYIYINNTNGDYSDHRPYGIWNASAAADVAGQLEYQTYTDFDNLPSGRGGMDFSNFRPSSVAGATGETLAGDWNSMYFFYDYDQAVQDTRDSLFEWSKWLWTDVGIRGFRMDAVKHFEYGFVGDLLDELHDSGMDPGMVVGEFFDTNPAALESWITNVESQMDADTKSSIDIRIFDFGLRSALKSACDAFGYDVRNVFNSGMVNGVGSNPYNVVTFINNHDYRTASESVANDPMLAYAYILTNNQIGLPCVFYPDYFGTDLSPDYPQVYLKDAIDELMAIHQEYIYQSSAVAYLSGFGSAYGSFYASGYANTTLSYQLSGGIGGKEVVVVINFAGEPLQVYQQINTGNVDPGQTFTELTGNAIGNTGSTNLNGNNELYMELPARSYGVWVQGAQSLPVSLVTFEATKSGKDALLQWKSEREENLLKYVIERAQSDGSFLPIGTQISLGTGSEYQFRDPDLGLGTWLYRLKMIDADDSYRYSAVKSLTNNGTGGTFKVYPIPSTGRVFLESSETSNNYYDWQILDVHGSRLKQGIASTGLMELPTESIASGVYFLRIQSDKATPTVIRFILTD